MTPSLHNLAVSPRFVRGAGFSALVGAVLGLAACGGEQPPEPATGSGQDVVPAEGPSGPIDHPAHALGLQPWHADFPGYPDRPYMSPRRPGRYFSRTHKQVLEQVTENLSGQCSREAWMLAKDFFHDVGDDVAAVLIRRADAAAQSPRSADHLENLLEAMAFARNPRLAECAVRMLDHSRDAVRSLAVQVLIHSGTPEAVREAWKRFPTLDKRGMKYWIHAARIQLGADAKPYFAEILAARQLGQIRNITVDEILQMPPETGVELLRPHLKSASDELQVVIASLMHRTGDITGSSLLIKLLREGSPAAKERALMFLTPTQVDVTPFRDEIMRLTIDDTPQVRELAMAILTRLEGQEIDDALESMTTDPAPGIRRAALRVLAERGNFDVLDDLIDEARTATGTRLSTLIEDLVAARSGRAVPVLVERMNKAEPDQRQGFLRAISMMRAAEGFEPLSKVFLAEPVPYGGDDSGADTNSVSLVALLLPNLEGIDSEAIALYDSLARGDYVRRALMLETLANLVGDREDREVERDVLTRMGDLVCDKSEIPQLRLLALELWRRHMTIDDVMRLRRQAEEEDAPMRGALNDFLLEFF